MSTLKVRFALGEPPLQSSMLVSLTCNLLADFTEPSSGSAMGGTSWKGRWKVLVVGIPTLAVQMSGP